MEDIELGGHIRLSGFKDLDYADMIVVKKVVGNYAKKFSTTVEITELSVRLKPVHKIDDNQKFEIDLHLTVAGKSYNATAIDKNLYVALDTTCKKIASELER